MAENRNLRFSATPQGGGYGMMTGGQQFIPNMQRFPMMQHTGNMMAPPGNMMPQGMYPPVQVQMQYRPPPPPYTNKLAEQYQQKRKSNQVQLDPEAQKQREEQERKKREFQLQQQKLKQFGKGSKSDMDPNKLIESMFGKTEKQKSQPAVTTAVDNTLDDSGFGDFKQASSSQNNQENNGNMENNNIILNQNLRQLDSNANQPNVATITPNESKKVPEKDILSMMMECSDLNASQKAKTFQKPSLREVQPNQQQKSKGSIHYQSHNSRNWGNTSEELTGIFLVERNEQVKQPSRKRRQSSGQKAEQQPCEGTLPAWCLSMDSIPPLYQQVLEASTINGKIETDRLYPILLLSGLSRDVLGKIWMMVNKTTPGQLINSELYCALALIALVQNNYEPSIDLLHKCPNPPVPSFQQGAISQPPSQQQVAPVHQPSGHTVVSPNVQMPAVFQTSPTPVSSTPSNNVKNTQSSVLTGSSQHSAPIIPPITQIQPPASAVQSGVTVNTFSTEDDFADFQGAPRPASDEFSDFHSAVVTSANTGVVSQPVKEETRYIISVPKPTYDVNNIPPEERYSNVRNYFGSDDSSSGTDLKSKKKEETHSLDDYDGFKSADSKPSDSTFSTSEQSENEDFRALETYIDKMTRNLDDSPLHRPISKLTDNVFFGKPASQEETPPSIPAVRSLWPVSTKGNKESESDEFDDFKCADVINQSSGQKTKSNSESVPSSTDFSLIGEEDKYAALRSVSLEDTEELSLKQDVDSTNSLDQSGNTVTLSLDQSNDTLTAVLETSAQSESDNWADFQTATFQGESVASDNTVDVKASVLGLFNEGKETSDEWSNFHDFKSKDPCSNVTDEWISTSTDNFVGSEGDWSGFTSIPEKKTSQDTAETNVQYSDFVNPSSVCGDDWADFKTAICPEQQAATTTSEIITVKSSNLHKSEVLSLFKVRDDLSNSKTLLPAPKREENVVLDNENIGHLITSPTSGKGKLKKMPRLSSSDDSCISPPPLIDEHDDDELGEYSAGYHGIDVTEISEVPCQNEHHKFYKNFSMSQLSVPVKKSSGKVVDDVSVSDQIGSDDFKNTQDPEDSQSVSSLDLSDKSKLQAAKDLEGSGVDSQSVSSYEFGNFDSFPQPVTNLDAKSLDSLDLKREYGESKSLDSLDLKRDGRDVSPEHNSQSDSSAETESANKVNDDTSNGDLSDTVMTSVGGTPPVGLMPVLGDRYSGVLEEVQGSERHAYEWERCLTECDSLIKQANNIFNSVSSSAVCNEVISSSQGNDYILGVIEIYRVACRVYVAMNTAAITTDKLKNLRKEIDIAWNNLSAFIAMSSIMPESKTFDYSRDTFKSDDESCQSKSCGICLLNVDSTNRGFGQLEDNVKLTYGGRQYHPSCANFWVNCVDSTLPALKIPDLL